MGTVIFNSLKVSGIVEKVHDAAPRFLAKRTHRWGSVGENELTSPPLGRQILVQICVHGGYTTEAALQAVIAGTLERRIRENGTLTIDTGGFTRTYDDCTYEGFERESGPLPDVGDGLGEGANCWFTHGVLKFYQLTPFK